MSGHRFPDATKAVEYLQRRLDEREAQGPRRKLLEDKERIQNRKKLDPCIPFLPGHDQEMWFAKLDSNGIWETVFEYLTDPSDVTSAYFSCEMFRNNLEEKRKMMMLPKIFGVLRDTDRLNYVGFGWARINLRVSEEKLEENRDILRQRLVSKTWKKSAEEVFLANQKFTRQRIGRLLDWNWGGPKGCRFRNEKDVDKALEMLRNPAICASLLRTVHVNDEHCSDKNAFYLKLAQFFDIHGDAVWAFQFHQHRDLKSGDFDFQAHCVLASKMPNLKGLYVDHRYETYDEADNIEDVDDDEYWRRARTRFEAANARLTQSVLRSNFPSLPALESFSVCCYPGQNEFLIAEILNNNLNIKTVFLGDWDHFLEGNTGIAVPSLVWESLRNLQLEYFELMYDAPGPLFMHDFLQLREYDLRLKYFRVHYDNFGNNNDYSVFDIGASDIFAVMGHFKDTLEEFCIDGFESARLVDDGRVVEVDFPKLKRFTLPAIEYDDEE